MKLAILTTIFGMFLLSDYAIAEDVKEKTSSTVAPAAVAEEKPGIVHRINTGTDDYPKDDGSAQPEDYEGQELPPYESYDPNTGLTDNTQSDAVGNLN